jgi:acylpyruvate hydrolase
VRFVSATVGAVPIAGAVVDGLVVPLIGIRECGRATPRSVLAAAALDRSRALPREDVRLRPVVPHPGKIICVGLNYRAHVDETGRDTPEYPVLFTKFASALIGPYDPILVPRESVQVDYEAELAVVIGDPGRRIAPENALSYVAGFTVANDVTMRDYQYKTHQWLQGKTWESSTPLGPELVTPDEVDHANLDIRLLLNGEVMQSSNTSQLMFDVPTLLSVISEFTTLEPGDVILTGTPGGVGFRRDPQVFLKPGDHVAVEIPTVGRIENEVRAEPDGH